MTPPILPGATLGVLGSGQLGRMFALAARRMGYRVHVYSPDADSPTGQVADREFVGPYEDLAAVREFAATCAALTIEFENIPAATLEAAAEVAPVRPGAHSLSTTQHRMREREFLVAGGFPAVPFAVVRSEAEMIDAVSRLGMPGVLKTAGFGYDGKGQRLVRDPSEAISDWDSVGRVDCVYERFIDFEAEISVISVRGVDGTTVAYPPFANAHANHILDVTRWPAAIPPVLIHEAQELGRALCESLEHVGVLCTELFVTKDGRLLVNELAPRPHNSGHITIEAAHVSQFEQQVRAMCGLPLGATVIRQPGAMANLLGDRWEGGEPDWAAALSSGPVALHLYGKAEARKGRKMGHISATAETADVAAELVTRARDLL